MVTLMQRGHNLVKCLCVDPTCDWLTDSNNDLQEASSQILQKFYKVFSLFLDLSETFNDLCLANHHLEFCSVTSDS